MASNPSQKGGLVRVVAYYVVFGAALVFAAQSVPMVQAAVAGGGLVELAGQAVDAFGPDVTPPVGEPIGGTWDAALLALISMLAALAIMVPVTWVYILTHRHRGYHESVVHTLLILPVAVTGIVMIVKTSIALAFSLAGIVAAVRFRTTLEDTKDAVYVFLAIGVGVACGDQSVGIAAVLSLVFNAVILVLWRTQFGNIYADAHGDLQLGDVLAGPASAASALRVGDPAILEAAAPGSLTEVAERAARIDRYLAKARGQKKRERINTLILVHAPSAGSAQTFVDGHLKEVASTHECVEIVPTDGGVILEYLARLEDPEMAGAVMDRLAEAPEGTLDAVELRSLKGLKPRA